MSSLSTLFASILRPKALLATVIVAATSASAQAGPVLFNAAGTGAAGAVSVATFDELPGNALALGAASLIAAANALPVGTVTTTGPFTLYYQANVRLLGPGGTEISTPGNFITAVAKFQETATVTSGSSTVTFNLAANQAGSYFDFFAHTVGQGSNASGVGFANDTPGTLIYSATPGTGGTAGNFTNNGGSVNLDQTTNPGSGTGQQTVSGFGGSSLTFNTAYFNTGYFVGNPGPSITFDTFNNLPFQNGIVPSSQFVNLTGAGAGSTFAGYVLPVLGTLNGANGRDVQFAADATSAFAVPEPASIAMTAMGLVGLGAFASRRRKAAV